MHDPRLQIPEPGHRLPPRDRRMKLLEREERCSLIALTAPTGYGKTTLLAARASALADRTAVGWLTLDTEDNDPGRLLAHVLAMLPAVREERKKAPSTRPSLEHVLPVLNALEEAYLFFDRYESIRSDEAHHLFERLIEGTGGSIRFLIASRERLPFAPELRRLQPGVFTMNREHLRLRPDEIQAYLRKRSIQPPASVLDELECAAEGWPLAIETFASMCDGNGATHPGEDDIIDALSARMQDIFLEDVLSSLPLRLQRFVLRTSIPASFDAALALELTEDDAFNDHLDRLRKQLPFLFEDGIGQYRYHPMFARCLQAHYRRTDKDGCLAVLEKLISWLARTGRPVDAVRYALDIPDYERASALLLADISATFSCPKRTVVRWLSRYPTTELSRRPAIAMLYAWFLTAEHRITAAETVMDQAEAFMGERLLPFPPTGEDLRGYFASIRSRIHFLRRESDRGMAYMQRTEALLHGPGMLYSHFNTIDKCGSSLLKSDAGHWGAVDQTLAMCEYAADRWNGVNQGYGLVAALLGECKHERNRLDEAEQHLQEARRIGLDLMDTGLILPATVALVQLKWDRGERQSAQVLLQETGKLIEGVAGEDGRAVLDACQCRIDVKANRPDKARAWLTRSGPAARGVPEMRKMYEYMTRLRALLFIGDLREGIELGEKLLHFSESWYLHYHIAEANMLLAAFYFSAGEKPTAFRKLAQALDIGQKEGYIQLFLSDWDVVEPAIRQYGKRLREKPRSVSAQAAACFERLLRAAADREQQTDPMIAVRKRLTAKESEILQALAEGKSNRIIADELSIRTETVKTHCKNIYKKLNLSGRKEAARLYGEFRSGH